VIVADVVRDLDLRVVAGSAALDREITGGYAADLLSCAIARARHGNVWATLQSHPNVIAVATLLELSAVIVTEGAAIAEDVIKKAEAENIPLLSTPHTTFWVVGRMVQLGIPAQE
jgi:predicted transcriptional regulator